VTIPLVHPSVGERHGPNGHLNEEQNGQIRQRSKVVPR
jgi:hypothetical protein